MTTNTTRLDAALRDALQAPCGTLAYLVGEDAAPEWAARAFEHDDLPSYAHTHVLAAALDRPDELIAWLEAARSAGTPIKRALVEALAYHVEVEIFNGDVEDPVVRAAFALVDEVVELRGGWLPSFDRLTHALALIFSAGRWPNAEVLASELARLYLDVVGSDLAHLYLDVVASPD